MGTDLRARVARNTQPPPPGTDIEKRDEQPPATLAQQVEQWQQEFQLAMPKGMEAQQLVRDALHLMRTTKHLAECTAESVLGALMTFAQLGLRPGVLGHGWPIPFKTRKLIGGRWTDVYQAQVVIGYKGYVELGHRSPQVGKIGGRAVHARDEFDIEYGLDEKLIHRPAKGDRGEVAGYYAVIKLVHGDPLFWHMTRDEVIEWRNRYATSVVRDRKGEPILDDNGNVQGSGPWFEMDGPPGATPFDQQAIKTCFLRAGRWMPKQIDANLARAMEVDGAVRISHPGAEHHPDDMLTAEHPVLDMEPEPEPAPDAAPATEAPPVVDIGRPAAAMRTEFPPVVGTGDDPPASQGLTTSIGKMIGRAGVSDDKVRKAVVSRMAGLPRTVTSTRQLTAAEARQVLQLLSSWEDAGVAAEQVAAVAAAAATEPAAPVDPASLPKPGTKAWHEDRHPRVKGDQVVRVDTDLTSGECGICEETAAGKR